MSIYGEPADDLRLNLECTREILLEQLPHDAMINVVDQTIQVGLQQLEQLPSTLPSRLIELTLTHTESSHESTFPLLGPCFFCYYRIKSMNSGVDNPGLCLVDSCSNA